jgi:hypothetical protein
MALWSGEYIPGRRGEAMRYDSPIPEECMILGWKENWSRRGGSLLTFIL